MTVAKAPDADGVDALGCVRLQRGNNLPLGPCLALGTSLYIIMHQACMPSTWVAMP